MKRRNKNKYIAIGDIHGRVQWMNDLNEYISQDYVIVFLGDYVSSHDDISAQEQLDNLRKILDYKTRYPEQIVLLRGNHDIQHLGYSWAQCSGLFPEVRDAMWFEDELGREFLEKTQWLHYDEQRNICFSHAGISNTWFSYLKEKYEIDKLVDINYLPVCDDFGFIPDNPLDCYGDSVTQSCTWIRPHSLIKDPYPVTQIVGHTRVEGIKCINLQDSAIYLCDTFPEDVLFITGDDNNIFSSLHLCDSQSTVI